MKQKVPLFIPAENFIPIEKENISVELKQQFQQYDGVFRKDSSSSIQSRLENQSVNHHNEMQKTTQTQVGQKNYLKSQSISSKQEKNTLFDDSDFIITEDSNENGIAANLQSLDMKRYSDRNNYFNNSIRVFNLQKNKSYSNFQNSNDSQQMNEFQNHQGFTYSQHQSMEFFNDNKQQSSIQKEIQQSAQFTNKSNISNQKTEKFVKRINKHDYELQEEIINSQSKQNIINQNENNKDIINSQQAHQQDQQGSLKNIIDIPGSNMQSQQSLSKQQKIQTKIFNNICQTQGAQESMLSNNKLKNDQQFQQENVKSDDQIKNQIQLFKDSNNQNRRNSTNSQQEDKAFQKQNSQARGRKFNQQEENIKEDVSPSPPNISRIEVQNEQQIHLLYIAKNNNMTRSENNRYQSEPVTLFMNNDSVSLFPQKDFDGDIQTDQNKKIEIINDDFNFQQKQNLIEISNSSFEQEQEHTQNLQNHSILNSNTFIVKKNPVTLPRQLNLKENKNQYFCSQIEEQKNMNDSDFFQKNSSLPILKANSDLDAFRLHNKILDNQQLMEYQFCNQKKDTEQNNSVINEKDISQILHHAEREDLKSFPQTPNKVLNSNSITVFFQNQPEIINLIFQNDIISLKKLIQGFSNQQKNIPDSNGNTLLYLATKLALKQDKYFEIFKYLLQNGGNPRIRNKEGWSPLDEAIFFKNVKLTTTLFEYIYQSKKKKITEQLIQLNTLLPSLPDCYIEIKWHFESMIPFLGYFAPSDTFRFWKIGTNFRLDTTLVGFNNLKCKRRNMSLLFKNQQLFLVNKSNKTITDPQEQLDIEEKKKIIQDLLESKPFNSSFDVTQCSVQPSKAWNGKIIKKKIASYNAEQYNMKLTYEYVVKNKSEKGESIYENNDIYQKSLFSNKESSNNPHIVRSASINNKVVKNSSKQAIQTSHSKEKEIKKTTFSLWMSKDYPIHFKQFMPVLQVLERTNPILSRLNEFLNKDEVKNLFQNEGFPVKIQIPLNYTIKSTIDFSDFKFLNSQSDELKNIFDIDPTYQVIPRKIAQKTLTRSKKRMILANMITA
ncbi:hypothetical protein ABPG74_014394 [Tetrahymena malaccensis]